MEVMFAGSEDSVDVVEKNERNVKRGELLRSNSCSPAKNDSIEQKQSDITVFAVDSEHSRMNPTSPSMNTKNSETDNDDDQLETTRAEMGEVKEENDRLKTLLSRIMKDYQALRTHLDDIIHQDHNKNTAVKNSNTQIHRENEDTDLVSLSLGSVPKAHKEEERSDLPREFKESELLKGELSLSLNSRFDGTAGLSLEEEEGVGQPSKSLKTTSRYEQEDLSHCNPVRNARVSIRSRCDTPTMNDGCQWRKYGQKVAKGNPCPRAYYRCTVAPSCPVRKQVQRCAEDMSILITTYEGTHNHPLSAAAATMASTTAAAASMLVSGASISSSAPGNFAPPFLSNHRQFSVSNPSISSFSPHPTITLDLTSQSSSQPSSQIKKFSTSLNFSSEQASRSYLSYNQPLGFLNHGRQAQETQMRQLFFQRTASSGSQVQQTQSGSSIAAATKAITSDPSFQSALAVAISSIVGGQGNRGPTDPLGHVNLKWADKFPPKVDVSGSGSSYLTRTTSLNTIQSHEKVAASESASASTINCEVKMK